MQKILKGLLFGLLALITLLFVSSSRVSALESSLRDNFNSPKKLATTEAVVTNTKAATASEFKQTACETHVKVINLRQNNIIEHADRVESRLEKLTAAVEKFYTDKVLPTGKTVPNYNTLVADVTAKQTAFTTALNKVKTDTQGLTCEKDQAKTQFTTFRTDMQSLLQAFKNYRLSVLSLMQAVKKVAEPSDIKQASGSAKEESE